ncbi:hypothetical protein C8J57DRAFT_1167087 [Mycena rebaudengoi]|nr:hypothetical protein C8J57DRAFT_1167087 [Mycena rebaudengoi]
MLLRQSLLASRWCSPRAPTYLSFRLVHSIPPISIPRRAESTFQAPFAPTSTLTSPAPPTASVSTTNKVYHGPMTATFKKLKVFSLSSLTLCITMAPLMFAVETNLPWVARAFLASTAIATSTVSTSLIAWAGSTYVTKLRITKAIENNNTEELEMTTLTLLLRPRITRVYDPAFIVPTKRPFAKWELAELVQLSPDMKKNITPGMEETVAETTDATGRVLGRWVVKWGEGGEGNCHQVGNITRYFNVHEELLPSS